MADHQRTLAVRPQGVSSAHRDGRRDTFATSDDWRTSSYETGESSNAGSLRGLLPTEDRNLKSAHGDPSLSSARGVDLQLLDGSNGRHEEPARRKQRHRVSGGFLLPNAVANLVVRGKDLGSRRQKAASASYQAPKPLHPGAGRDTVPGARSSSEADPRYSMKSPRTSLGDPAKTSMDNAAYSNPRSSLSPPETTPPRLDYDSSQIVHMALNLSESRRIASRRTASRGAPPRLAPLPDSSTGSNLKQHLQQQRKSSLTMSPKPGQTLSPRVPSTARANSPLQPAFDIAPDASYRYQFSSSTLSRAQKAKEHLELMAHYRRLLEVLPPLKPGHQRPSMSNSLGSPLTSARSAIPGAADSGIILGRQYNPLQYIRNRKVRARERKIIDGERQGFGDVECVGSWVDTVCQRAVTSETESDYEGSIMPAFPGADELETQTSPDVITKTAHRVRRPRVDWFMEPCDMIADAYWLEQNGHKSLIEDRQWRRLFPPSAELNRPMSREVDDPATKIASFPLTANEQDGFTSDGKEIGLSKVRTDVSQSSTKERAKQKLHSIAGGFHHRHNSSVNSHQDFLRTKRASFSEFSDSENEINHGSKRQSRYGRSGTISGNTNELLERQMLEMVAREAREKELDGAVVVETEHFEASDIITPERKVHSKPSSRFQSRSGSMADNSDSDRKAALKRALLVSPHRYSYDQHIPNFSGSRPPESVGNDSSVPNSPDLYALHNNSVDPIANLNLSPSWSRAGSPTRNPLTKIKHIIRDRNGESGGENQSDAELEGDKRISRQDLPRTTSETTVPLVRRQSSPMGKPLTGGIPEIHMHHRNKGSVRLRQDDASGLRGMLIRPRIDTVLRGGVSKLGDIIWKKDAPGESQPDFETTDESDNERARGRVRPGSRPLSRRTSKRDQNGPKQMPKHFLDSMPQFHHASDFHHDSGTDGSQKVGTSDGSGNHSYKSSRFDMLKPPQNDVRSPSSSVSPPTDRPKCVGDSEISEAESVTANAAQRVRDADKRLNSAIALPNLHNENSSISRHWSITDHNGPIEQAPLSRREVARMRTLILSTGIKAMEIRRRALEQHKPLSRANLAGGNASPQSHLGGIAWPDIARLGPRQPELYERQVAFCEMYPFAAQTLGVAIQAWGQRWQLSADRFTNKTSPELQKRIWSVRSRVADDLSEKGRRAADQADETSRDLALGQPLKVKHVIDTIEKMLRRRRRRFRWVRRGLWLMVEWLLVGIMWYVWFVVMILRIFLGIGKGALRGARWLLWL